MTDTPTTKTVDQYAEAIRKNVLLWNPVPARLIGELIFLVGITQWWDVETGIDKVEKVVYSAQFQDVTIYGHENVCAYDADQMVLVR